MQLGGTKMKNYRNLTLILFLISVFILSGCTTDSKIIAAQNEPGSANGCTAETCSINPAQPSANTVVSKIEVFHFHGTNQCTSCIAVGALAEETVNTYFSDEVKSGKIVFDHINGDLPENKLKVMQYGATGSSLWLGVYDNNGFHPEQNTNVWYKIDDKEAYKTYLKGIIEKRLQGDYSQ